LNRVRKLDIAPNHENPICGTNQDSKMYPRNIILDLDQPFTLKSIPVSPEGADQLIKSTEQDRPGVNDLVYRDRRLVLLRLKIDVLHYNDTVKFRGHWRGVVSGNVEGYEIYADYGRHNLLFSSTTSNQ